MDPCHRSEPSPPRDHAVAGASSVDSPPDLPTSAAEPAPPLRTPQPVQAGQPAKSGRPPLVRPQEGRWIGGVAAGLAAHLDVPVDWVRIAFVLVAVLTNGVAVAVYGVLWAFLPQSGSVRDDAFAEKVQADNAHLRGRPRLLDQGRQGVVLPPDEVVKAADRRELKQVLFAGVALLVGAASMGASGAGVSMSYQVWVPLGVVVVGAVIALTQLDRSEQSRWLGASGWMGVLRLVAGVVVTVTGVLLLFLPEMETAQVTTILLAAAAVLLGMGIVVGPWVLRLFKDLEAERALRVLETERAEITAHLHDSVLQTLALIQRRPEDPVEVRRLARSQERELRAWLYGGPDVRDSQPATLKEAVRRICGDIEDTEGVPVEVIVVGDTPMRAEVGPLTQALREAVSNAVRHGKVGVSVYVECDDDVIEAFVRDRGKGFDLAEIPVDRFGVRGSIIDRMSRHGGSATVRPAAGGGTEVTLRLPLSPPEVDEVDEADAPGDTAASPTA